MPIKKVNPIPDFNPSTRQVKRGGLGNKILLLILVVLIIALVVVLYNYRQISKKVTRLSTTTGQQELAKKEINDLVNEVKKLIVLPENEIPNVATITDADGLAKNQPFYKGSSNGDKVLIYFNAQKAYIYSLSNNKLVNVGPVYIDNKNNEQAFDPEVKMAKLVIEVRNGSGVTGNASKMAEKLKANSSFSVLGVTNANTSTHKDTILVDLTSGEKSALFMILEKELNVKAVKTIPVGEKSSTADVLIIVGVK